MNHLSVYQRKKNEGGRLSSLGLIWILFLSTKGVDGSPVWF